MMEEEQDSRTATLGRKRGFDNIPPYQSVSTDSSDEEPVHKRLKQTPGKQREYISLLDSDDPDSEEDASAEPESGTASDAHKAGSAEAIISPGGGMTDATMTHPGQDLRDEDMPAMPNGSLHDGLATRLPVHIVHYPGAADRIAMAEGRRIHLDKLSINTTAHEVLSLFKDYEVDSVYMPVNHATKKLTGYGFVCLPSAADAQKAIAALSGSQVLGKPVSMKLSQGMGSKVFATDVPQSGVISSSTTAVQQPHQPTAMKKESVEIRKANDEPLPPKPLVHTKKEENLRRIYGDEYIVAIRAAAAQQSVHPVQLHSDRRSFDIGNRSFFHPDLLENNLPIPFIEFCLAAFIPPLLRANPDKSAFFLVKQGSVSQAFSACVRVQYHHVPKKRRSDAAKKASECGHETIAAQITSFLASAMPEVLEGIAQSPEYANFPPKVKKAVHNALVLAASAAQLEKERLALDFLIPALHEEAVIVPDTELPKKFGSYAKLASGGSAELSLRYVSDPEESNLLTQNPAPDHDIQSELELVDDPRDVELREKYFPPAELNYGPRCLTCGNGGHSTSRCAPVTCRSCGHIEVHYTWACPQRVRCQKCRELGHSERSCPERLMRSRAEAVKCEGCGSFDHVEGACHQLWRTYSAPATTRKVAGLLVNCFSCGHSNHFGMDCDLRLKTRERASLTFSMGDARRYIDPKSSLRSLSAGKDYSIKGSANKSKEYSIRGRARQDPINIDTDGDDGDFLRPPAKKVQSGHGSIQIKPRNANQGRFQDPLQPVENFSRDPMPVAYQSQYSRGRERSPAYHDYRDDQGPPYFDDHYDPQNRYYAGQRPVDHYESRFDTPYGRGNGFPQGGNVPRGGNATRGRDAPRIGNTSKPRSKRSKRGGSARRRGL